MVAFNVPYYSRWGTTDKFIIEIFSPESFRLDTNESTSVGFLYCDDFFIKYIENKDLETKEKITYFEETQRIGTLTVDEICSDFNLCDHSETAFQKRNWMKLKKTKLIEIFL